MDNREKIKFNLKTRPKTWIQWHGENREISREVTMPKNMEEWVEGFKKKLGDFDAQKWFDENVYEDWTWEGMLKKFIEKEILGEQFKNEGEIEKMTKIMLDNEELAEVQFHLSRRQLRIKLVRQDETFQELTYFFEEVGEK